MPGFRGPGREAQGGCDPLCSQASREKGNPRERWRWQLQRGRRQDPGSHSKGREEEPGRQAGPVPVCGLRRDARPRELTGQPLTDKEVSRPRGPCHEARPAL